MALFSWFRTSKQSRNSMINDNRKLNLKHKRMWPITQTQMGTPEPSTERQVDEDAIDTPINMDK